MNSEFANLTIGVLGLQGAFEKHRLMVERCGATGLIVRRKDELDCVGALIIPGGESTTINILFERTGLGDEIRKRVLAGMPIYGTCMGMIVIARNIAGMKQDALGLLDVEVERNAYGRQLESFESDLTIPTIGPDPFRGVFIRAPIVKSVGPKCEILCKHEDRIVMVRQGSMLGSSFHPELTDDGRIHQMFLRMVRPETRD